LNVLFALNERYFLNEKGGVALAETLAVKPVDLKRRVSEVFAELAVDGGSIRRSIELLRGLAAETQQLVRGGGT
jgi:hypothetical protein